MKLILSVSALLLADPVSAGDKTCSLTGWSAASYDHRQRKQEVQFADTDHYAMMFSWAPGYCKRRQRKDGSYPADVNFQCASDNDFGWIVHGLWPQAPIGLKGNLYDGHPRYCTKDDLPKLPLSLIKKHMCTAPGARLLQSQWEKHGACAFDNAAAYFEQMTTLYQNLTFPDDNPGREKMTAWMKENNPSLRDVLTGWKRGEFVVCYDKSFKLMDCR